MSRRQRYAGLSIAAALAVAVVATLASVRYTRAQETDLPAVPADSVSPDFLRKTAPGAVAVPQPPAAPRAPDSPQEIVVRRRMHAGENDVVQVGHDIVVEKGEHILGQVVAMGGSVTVLGTVDDDVVALGGDVSIEDGAQVRGDAVSIGGTVHKAPNAVLQGSTVTVGNVPKSVFKWGNLNAVGQGIHLAGAVANFLFWLFVAWVIVLVLSDRSKLVVREIETAPGPSIGWGILALIAVVPGLIAAALVAALLAVTIIGIPVAVLVLLGYIVAVAVLVLWGGVLGAAALGGWLVRRLSPHLGEPSLMRNTLIGVCAVCALGLIAPIFKAVGFAVPPIAFLGKSLGVFGSLLKLGVVLAGIGGLLRARAGQVEPWRMPWGGAGPTWSQTPAGTPPPPPPQTATPEPGAPTPT